MATDRQIAANRRNGSLGRGPKTSAGKARSSRNALKHGLSIPVNRDKTLRRQIAVLARILAQSEAGNVFWQARAAAEAELELVRARAVMEAVLTRAGNTAEWNGGPEQGTALIHVLPKLQRLERYERRAFSKRRRAPLNRHGLREKHMCDCLKLNLGSFCHFDDERLGHADLELAMTVWAQSSQRATWPPSAGATFVEPNTAQTFDGRPCLRGSLVARMG